MGWSAPIAAPKCPACKAAVFPAESFMASDRTPFHKVLEYFINFFLSNMI